MMDIKPSYDLDKEAIVVQYENNLLVKHSGILEKKVKELVPSATVERTKNDLSNSITIFIPHKKEMTVSGPGIMSIAMPIDIIQKIDTALRCFILDASMEEMKTLEIIPLNNYPIEDISKDVKEAVKCKRNICIIEDYNDYLNGKNVIINCKDIKQSVYPYATNDYCNVVLACVEKDKDQLKKLTEKTLNYYEWM